MRTRSAFHSSFYRTGSHDKHFKDVMTSIDFASRLKREEPILSEGRLMQLAAALSRRHVNVLPASLP